jgi:hypothetical protein
MWGFTAGGEEDGVNNEDANPEDLYSKPEEFQKLLWGFVAANFTNYPLVICYIAIENCHL